MVPLATLRFTVTVAPRSQAFFDQGQAPLWMVPRNATFSIVLPQADMPP